MHEDALVGAVGDDDFLEDEFQEVGKGLEQPERADHIGAAAHLHGGPDLAVGIDEKGDDDQQRDEQGHAWSDDESQRGEESRSCPTPPPPAGARGAARAFGHDSRGPCDRVGEIEILDRAAEGADGAWRRPAAASSASPAGSAGVISSSIARCGSRRRRDRTAAHRACPRARWRRAAPTGRAGSPSLRAPRRAGRAARRVSCGRPSVLTKVDGFLAYRRRRGR